MLPVLLGMYFVTLRRIRKEEAAIMGWLFGRDPNAQSPE